MCWAMAPQGLHVAVGSLPQTIGEVTLPLKEGHQPLVTPLPVNIKLLRKLFSTANIFQVNKVSSPTFMHSLPPRQRPHVSSDMSVVQVTHLKFFR